jgi:hypothetical protein
MKCAETYKKLLLGGAGKNKLVSLEMKISQLLADTTSTHRRRE